MAKAKPKANAARAARASRARHASGRRSVLLTRRAPATMSWPRWIEGLFTRLLDEFVAAVAGVVELSAGRGATVARAHVRHGKVR